MAQKAAPGEKTLLQIASEGLGYEDIQTSDDLKKLADSGIVKEWVLPFVTGASAETDDYKPGPLDAALTIPVGGGIIKTVGKAAKKIPFVKKAIEKIGKVSWERQMKKQLGVLPSQMAAARARDKIKIVKKKITPYLPKKIAELEQYGKELLVKEKNLPSHLKREVVQARAFTKNVLTNKKGFERFLNTIFIEGGIAKGLDAKELKTIKSYMFNTRRGREFHKFFKNEISDYIDNVPYFDMYDLTMKSTTQGSYFWGGWIGARTAKKTIGVTTGSSMSTKIHEFIHAGQLGSAPNLQFGTGKQHMHRIMGEMEKIFDPVKMEAQGQLPTVDAFGKVIKWTKAEIKRAEQDWLDYKKHFLSAEPGARAAGKTRGKMVASREIAEMSEGRMSQSKDIVFMNFQRHLKEGRKKSAKVFEVESELKYDQMQKRQVKERLSKEMGLAKKKHTTRFLDFIKQTYADSRTTLNKKRTNYNRYVNEWWETTARINEMRYAEFIGNDPKKTSAYKALSRIYDDAFIDDLNKYYWAAFPVAGAGLSNQEIIDSYIGNE